MANSSGVSVKDYQYPVQPTWCPGCGNFSILGALKQALVRLGMVPHETLAVSGIGCGSKLPHYMEINGFHSIHGRPLTLASGARLANPDLNVIVTAGDGDSYGIGANHFLHTCRRNINLTHLVEDNQVYGLTKGQYSPTSEEGFVTKTSPEGAIEPPVNPIALALASKASFVSRGFAGDVPHLTELLVEAIGHEGYALVDILQPCVTFNRVNTYDYYEDRVYNLDENYDPSDISAAREKAHEWGEKIPIGIIFRETRPTYEQQVPVLKDGPVVDGEVDKRKWDGVDLDALKTAFM